MIYGGSILKKKGSTEEMIFTGIFLIVIWVYFKTSSLSTTLIIGFAMLILYVAILILKTIIHNRKMLSSGIDKIDQMNGHQFEEYLSHLLSKKDYKVKLTKATGDFGADLVLTSSTGKCIVVQAKRYKKNVGIKAVQEVGTSMPHYKASEAWVVTNSFYTKAARSLAKSNGIHLYDRYDLVNWIIELKKANVA